MLYRAKSALESQKAFVRSWDCYIQAYLEKRGAKQPKAPDTMRWLSKVVSICEDYLRISDLATSVTLSNFLLEDVKIVAIPNTPPTPHTTKLDCETMERILLAADCEIAKKSIEELLQLLAQTHPDTSPSSKDEYQRKTLRLVHCECQLLTKLHNRPAIPYVGVSKRSCAFCATYFAAYRAATNTTICMRSSHGRTAQWTSPTLDDPEVEAEVRNGVASGLLKLIGTAWNDYNRGLLGSQSTVVSREVARDETLGEGVVEEHDRILKKWV
ncbi:hypothetical protein DFH06DRAFT_1170628 [Mycena polygramma]|nr:hypothetical protein DFH06DRAFT_1170628 [Mycena polygramma]